MIVGVGLDVVSVARVTPAVEERAFTAAERASCEGRADRAQALAARFAAKEAFFKALGTGWGGALALQHVEVIAGSQGKPELRLTSAPAAHAAALGVQRIHVTLSHEETHAAAVVILET